MSRRFLIMLSLSILAGLGFFVGLIAQAPALTCSSMLLFPGVCFMLGRSSVGLMQNRRLALVPIEPARR